MADPVTITCDSACTVTLVQQISLMPFDMTLEAASQLASAILAVWAVAWVLRTLADFLASRDGNSTNQE